MQIKATTLLSILTLTTMPLAGQAQEKEIEEITVWGTQVNSSSVFISEDQIKLKQADHLSDLLRDIPGVDIGGSHSVNQRINIRGLDDTDLNVTIDGANQNNYMYHHMGNLLVNADILKAVDLQVGTNSVISGGLGGAVSFETKDAKDLLKAGQNIGSRIQTAHNSNALNSYSLTGFAQINDKIDVIAYFSSIDRDNFEDGAGTEVMGSDGNIDNLIVKFGYDLTPNQRIDFSYDKYQDQGDYAQRPDMGVDLNQQLSGDILFPTEYDRDTYTANYELDLADRVNLRLTAYNNEMNLQRLTLASGDITSGISTNRGLTLLAKSDFETGMMKNELIYGLELETQESDYTLNYGNGDPSRLDTQKSTSSSIYIEDRIFISERFSLKPGIRYEIYEMDTASNTDTYKNWSYGLAAEFQMNDYLSLAGGRTELFKGPELSEIFTGSGIGNLTNPALQPETGFSDEIGLRFLAYDLLASNTLSANLTFFRTNLDNKIQEVDYPFDDCLGRGCAGWYANTSNVVIEGYEASTGFSKGGFSTLVSYSKSDSDIDSSGETLEREVGDSIGVSFSYFSQAHNLSLNWTSRIVLDETSSQPNKEAYDVHNISARWQPAFLAGSDLTVGVDNLFDELYTSHASRVGSFNHPVFGVVVLDDYEPGRNIKATLSYQF